MRFTVRCHSLYYGYKIKQVTIPLLSLGDDECIVITKSQLFEEWRKARMGISGDFQEDQGNELLVGITIARQIMRQLDINPDLQEIEI